MANKLIARLRECLNFLKQQPRRAAAESGGRTPTGAAPAPAGAEPAARGAWVSPFAAYAQAPKARVDSIVLHRHRLFGAALACARH
jgi:hypothetical protein